MLSVAPAVLVLSVLIPKLPLVEMAPVKVFDSDA
jgi:hypothetical protein